MKNKPDYHTSVRMAISAARKAGNGLAVLYYSDALARCSACASWETFKGTCAGEEFVIQNAEKIPELNTMERLDGRKNGRQEALELKERLLADRRRLYAQADVSKNWITLPA